MFFPTNQEKRKIHLKLLSAVYQTSYDKTGVSKCSRIIEYHHTEPVAET